eukprot:GABW01004700.1.p2 GENE.GABW01004700.1~~GABW01004700.1.p2  ORF type:complete len:87 (+),score=15.24 GABW01004700.1:104-364(+)
MGALDYIVPYLAAPAGGPEVKTRCERVRGKRETVVEEAGEGESKRVGEDEKTLGTPVTTRDYASISHKDTVGFPKMGEKAIEKKWR